MKYLLIELDEEEDCYLDQDGLRSTATIKVDGPDGSYLLVSDAPCTVTETVSDTFQSLARHAAWYSGINATHIAWCAAIDAPTEPRKFHALMSDVRTTLHAMLADPESASPNIAETAAIQMRTKGYNYDAQQLIELCESFINHIKESN